MQKRVKVERIGIEGKFVCWPVFFFVWRNILK
jgi:hypothetical protein